MVGVPSGPTIYFKELDQVQNFSLRCGLQTGLQVAV
jgi:hypothetical protein